VHVRVELAVRLDLGESLPAQQVGELTMHQADSFLQLRFLVLLGCIQRAPEVVEDGQ
jgi:hypothetical protein